MRSRAKEQAIVPQTTSPGRALLGWQKVSASRFGRWVFARRVCQRAPYFASIRPAFHELRPTFCKVSMRKRKSVQNHIGTVHALAVANLCELAAGLVTEVTVPNTMRWIPRGMTIEYLRKAETDITAIARLDKTEWSGDAEDVGVPVSAVDTNGTEVVRAVITMYVSPRSQK